MTVKRKDPAAVKLGKKRAAQVQQENPEGMRDLGALGGAASARKLSAAERREKARSAAAAMWKKKRAKESGGAT